MTSLLGAEQVGVAHRAADDAPQHVAAVLVAREHAVGDEHRAAAGVLGEDAHREAVAVVVVARACSDLPVRLQACSMSGCIRSVSQTASTPWSRQRMRSRPAPVSIDGLGSGVRRAVGRLVVLHEDQVPELHEPVAVRVVERAAVGAERRAAVDVDLGARTARAGVAHLPEVVLVAEPLDAVHRHADLLVPDGLGLVVALVDGDPQAIAVEAERVR